MDLNELKALMAASLVAGAIATGHPGAKLQVESVQDSEIAAAVRLAQKIWDETLRQDRED